MTKREAILYSAMELITQNGFHGTSMAMIYTRAGVAAGTVYHHFSGKEALIDELHTQLKTQFGKALQVKESATMSVKEKFFHIWRNMYQFFIQHPKEFLFLEQYANSSYISKETRTRNQQYYQDALDYLGKGMKQGVFRPMSVNIMANLVFGAAAITAKMHLSGEVEITPEVLEIIVQSSWDGVKTT